MLIRGVKFAVIKKSVKETKRYYGYLSLLSNEKMNDLTALEL